MVKVEGGRVEGGGEKIGGKVARELTPLERGELEEVGRDGMGP